MAGGLNPVFVCRRIIFPLPLVTFVISTLLLQIGAHFVGPQSSQSTAETFYWIDIVPTENLLWHKCYEPLVRECARLLVPLDHHNHSSGYATIALIRKPSTFTTFANNSSGPDPRYRGPILFNPSGPGVSGVDLILRTGDSMAQILGEQFDIVGFDPRGVARSTPKIMFVDAEGRGEREMWVESTVCVLRGGLSDPNADVDEEKGESLERAWGKQLY